MDCLNQKIIIYKATKFNLMIRDLGNMLTRGPKFVRVEFFLFFLFDKQEYNFGY
jgi:hypothetical protein